VGIFMASQPHATDIGASSHCPSDGIHEAAVDTLVKLTGALYGAILADLSRPHPFAAERVGFALGRLAKGRDGNRIVLLSRYHPVPDDQYIQDENVGARIGRHAITWAMQEAYRGRPNGEGLFHVHVHDHRGAPAMSGTDRRELPEIVKGVQSVGRSAAHGIVVFSRDHGSAWGWLPGAGEAVPAASIAVIGAPVSVFAREKLR